MSGYSTFKERCRVVPPTPLPRRHCLCVLSVHLLLCRFQFKQPMLNSTVWGIVKQSRKCVDTFTISFGFCTLQWFYPSSIWLELFKIALLQAKSQVTSNLCPFGCVGDGAYGFSFKMCKLSVNWLSELNARQNVKSKRRQTGGGRRLFLLWILASTRKTQKTISVHSNWKPSTPPPFCLKAPCFPQRKYLNWCAF